MKTILIERVSNGWLVRPFSPSESWSIIDHSITAVFTRIEDLQAALPDLLQPQDVNIIGKAT